MRLIPPSFLVLVLAAAALQGAGAAQPGSQADGFVQAPRKAVGAGIDIRYRVVDTPAVGKPIRVEIVLGRITDPGGATARLTAESSLRLETNAGPYSFASGRDGLLQATVVPQAEGLAYLNLFVTQRGATSSTSIPIRTGDAGTSTPLGATGRLKELPDGSKILSLPAK